MSSRPNARGYAKAASGSTLRERLDFAFMSVVVRQKPCPPTTITPPSTSPNDGARQGKTVHVTLKTGVVFEGQFFTACTSVPGGGEPGIVLKMARKVKDPAAKGRDRRIIRSLIIHAQDFVEIEARDLPAVSGKSGMVGGFTDTEISGSNVQAGQHRELTRWVDDSGGDKNMSLGGTESRGWDQFAENEKLFGVTSTYNERLYTTELNKSTLTPAQLAHAEKMAREIEQDTSGNTNMHIREERGQMSQADRDMDEEDKHSSVLTAAGGQRHSQPVRANVRGAPKAKPADGTAAAAAAAAGQPARPSAAKKPFKLNPSAASWKPNPAASAFIPGGGRHNVPSSSVQSAPMGVPVPMPSGAPTAYLAMQHAGFQAGGFQTGMRPPYAGVGPSAKDQAFLSTLALAISLRTGD
jgi:hypothetical protein